MIVIIGAGAMGSVYAGLLAKAGEAVSVVDIWQEHIEVIGKNGLRVSGFSGDYTENNITALGPEDKLPEAKLYIIATKASGVGDAARKIAREGTPGAPVLTIQNGFGSGAIAAAEISSDRLLLGVAEGFGASLKGPGHAHHTGMTRIRLGEYTGGMTERLKSVATIWKNAGFPAESYDDIDQLIWEKFVCNVTLSAPCTVTGLNIAELMAVPDLWQMALSCAKEAYAVGKAKGVAFSYDDPVQYVTAFAEKLGEARPSMALDHLARKPSEINIINGMVPVLAEEIGLDAPVNRTLSALVRLKEKEF